MSVTFSSLFLELVLLLAGNAEALATLPKTLATYAQFLRELGLIHGVLVLKNEALEVVF